MVKLSTWTLATRLSALELQPCVLIWFVLRTAQGRAPVITVRMYQSVYVMTRLIRLMVALRVNFDTEVNRTPDCTLNLTIHFIFLILHDSFFVLLRSFQKSRATIIWNRQPICIFASSVPQEAKHQEE